MNFKSLPTIFLVNVFLGLPSLFANAQITSSALPTDAQIAEMIITVNNAEITAAQLAKKSSDPKVSQFAEHMMTAHSDSDRQINELQKKMDLKSRSSTLNEKLKIDTGNQLVALKKLKGKEFDNEYISDQIKDHTDVLNLFDRTFIPSAKEAQLKTLLMHTRADVASHLDLAKKIQREM